MIFAVLTGFSLSLDAFAVCIANSLAIKPFKFKYALIMALYFGFFQFLMPVLGNVLALSVAHYIQAVGPYISFVLLAFIGGKMLLEGIQNITEKNDSDSVSSLAFINGKADHRKLFLLAVATSIDALAVGVAAGLDADYMRGLSIFVASTVIGIVTAIVCLAGSYISKLFSRVSVEKAEIIGGTILVLIGLKLLISGIIA